MKYIKNILVILFTIISYTGLCFGEIKNINTKSVNAVFAGSDQVTDICKIYTANKTKLANSGLKEYCANCALQRKTCKGDFKYYQKYLANATSTLTEYCKKNINKSSTSVSYTQNRLSTLNPLSVNLICTDIFNISTCKIANNSDIGKNFIDTFVCKQDPNYKKCNSLTDGVEYTDTTGTKKFYTKCLNDTKLEKHSCSNNNHITTTSTCTYGCNSYSKACNKKPVCKNYKAPGLVTANACAKTKPVCNTETNECEKCPDDLIYSELAFSCKQCDLTNTTMCEKGQTCVDYQCKDFKECVEHDGYIELKVNGAVVETKKDSCKNNIQIKYDCNDNYYYYQNQDDIPLYFERSSKCQYNCNSATKRCNDCPADKPIKDTVTNTCVECTNNNTSMCKNDAVCINNMCKTSSLPLKTTNNAEPKVETLVASTTTKTNSTLQANNSTKTCSGVTPIFNEQTNTCVECKKNNDCKDPNKPYCATSSTSKKQYQCIACTSLVIKQGKSPCKANERCNDRAGYYVCEKCPKDKPIRKEGTNSCMACPSDKPIFDESTLSCVKKSFEPRLECITDNGDGYMTAYFGYENFTNKSFKISDSKSNYVTKTGGGKSRIYSIVDDATSPKVYDYELEEFLPGNHKGVMQVSFKSTGTATWNIKDNDGNTYAIKADKNSPKCKDVMPVFECIVRNDIASKKYVAIFSYDNKNEFPIYIPNGDNNKIKIDGINQEDLAVMNKNGEFGQVEIFLPGIEKNVVAVTLKSDNASSISWNLATNGSNNTKTAKSSNNFCNDSNIFVNFNYIKNDMIKKSNEYYNGLINDIMNIRQNQNWLSILQAKLGLNAIRTKQDELIEEIEEIFPNKGVFCNDADAETLTNCLVNNVMINTQKISTLKKHILNLSKETLIALDKLKQYCQANKSDWNAGSSYLSSMKIEDKSYNGVINYIDNAKNRYENITKNLLDTCEAHTDLMKFGIKYNLIQSNYN